MRLRGTGAPSWPIRNFASAVFWLRERCACDKRPRSIQVEISPMNRMEIEAIMAECGFRVEARHYTMAGKKRMHRGVRETEFDHNAIFVPLSHSTEEV